MKLIQQVRFEDRYEQSLFTRVRQSIAVAYPDDEEFRPNEYPHKRLNHLATGQAATHSILDEVQGMLVKQLTLCTEEARVEHWREIVPEAGGLIMNAELFWDTMAQSRQAMAQDAADALVLVTDALILLGDPDDEDDDD